MEYATEAPLTSVPSRSARASGSARHARCVITGITWRLRYARQQSANRHTSNHHLDIEIPLCPAVPGPPRPLTTLSALLCRHYLEVLRPSIFLSSPSNVLHSPPTTTTTDLHLNQTEGEFCTPGPRAMAHEIKSAYSLCGTPYSQHQRPLVLTLSPSSIFYWILFICLIFSFASTPSAYVSVVFRLKEMVVIINHPTSIIDFIFFFGQVRISCS